MKQKKKEQKRKNNNKNHWLIYVTLQITCTLSSRFHLNIHTEINAKQKYERIIVSIRKTGSCILTIIRRTLLHEARGQNCFYSNGTECKKKPDYYL